MNMTRLVVKSRIGSDGVLRLHLPVGQAEAGKEVQVTVEPAPAPAMSQEEWRERILATAGKWQGDFERPPQGEYEEREPLA
jgi:hypothetical protein